jgi:hypothetical protein
LVRGSDILRGCGKGGLTRGVSSPNGLCRAIWLKL